VTYSRTHAQKPRARAHTHQIGDYFEREIGLSQRPLGDNTQHSQQTDIHTPATFEMTVLISERPQTYTLDRRVSEIKLSPKTL